MTITFMYRALASLYLVCFLTGCHNGEYFYDHQISGPYYLNATNTASQMSVMYAGKDGLRVERIKETVTAIGWDDNYITAMQHSPSQPNKHYFFYIDRRVDDLVASLKSVVHGPLSEEEFLAAQRELHLPSITEQEPVRIDEK